jgi:DNA-binding XRE family transcriptional regulator
VAVAIGASEVTLNNIENEYFKLFFENKQRVVEGVLAFVIATNTYIKCNY